MWRLIILGLGACHFKPGAMRGTDAGSGDAGSPITGDARPDAPPPIDAPADARVCPPASTGCTAFSCAGSSSCFYVCSTTRTWNAAASACVSNGLGCIATIHDQAEQDCVAAAAMPMFPDIVWFGWVQTQGSTEPAGGWHWQCGASSYVAPNWGNGEPNNQGGHENCGAMTNGGIWIDGDCAIQARYVCELP